MPSLEAEMLAFIRAGLDHHNSTCPLTPKAILLNPANHELFGWDELWGIPVLPDDRVAPKRFRIDCDGSAFGIEEEVAEAVAAQSEERLPLVVPLGPREDEPTAGALGAAAVSRPPIFARILLMWSGIPAMIKSQPSGAPARAADAKAAAGGRLHRLHEGSTRSGRFLSHR